MYCHRSYTLLCMIYGIAKLNWLRLSHPSTCHMPVDVSITVMNQKWCKITHAPCYEDSRHFNHLDFLKATPSGSCWWAITTVSYVDKTVINAIYGSITTPLNINIVVLTNVLLHCLITFEFVRRLQSLP